MGDESVSLTNGSPTKNLTHQKKSMRSQIKYLRDWSMKTSHFDHWDVNDVLADATVGQSGSTLLPEENASTTMASTPDTPQHLPSVGSAAHAFHTCQPCHYKHTKHGCMRGVLCGFCHFDHGKHTRRNKPPRTTDERID